MGIITLIINALTGGVAKELASALNARQQALTDQERIAADERIARLQDIRAIQVAESGSRLNALMRALIAVGPALYLFKIFAVDKVWCSISGCALRTDALSPELWKVVTAVVGFYFLYDLGMGATRVIAARKKG